MPIKPGKDETQDEWMARCVPEMMGAHGGTKRPQDQAVAACLEMWREAGKGHAMPTKQDALEPAPDESHSDWMARCQQTMGESGIAANEAADRCQVIWDNCSVVGVAHKTTISKSDDPLEYVMSDGTIDHLDDVIEPDGWDLTNFKKGNAPALFNHNSDFVIGKWTNVRIEDGALRGHLQLAEAGTSERINEIRSLVRQGILRAVSVGFRAIERKSRADSQRGGIHFLKQMLLECSLVAVPANPNALQIAKRLNVSRSTLDLVFGKSAAMDAILSPGKSADRQSPFPIGRKMTPLAQRITDGEAELIRMKDQLTEQIGKVDDSNPDDASTATIEELTERIAQRRKAIDALKIAETQLALTSVPARPGGSTELTVDHRRPFNVPAKTVKPVDYFFRAGVCAFVSKITHEPVSMIRQRFYGDDEATRQVVDMLVRTATAPAMTSTVGWAAELVATLFTDFINLLIPQAVYPGLAAQGVRYTFGRYGKITIPVRQTTPTLAGSFVGEGSPIPVRQAGFASISLTPKKMAVISSMTREISLHSTPAIEGIIRQAIIDDTSSAIDNVLLDANAATTVRPAGLKNGVSGLTPTAGGGFNALVADIKQMLNVLVSANALRNPVWIMNPAQVTSIGLTQSGLGTFPFEAQVNQGKLQGYPIIQSTNQPNATVILLDAADFASVTGDEPQFEISDQATLVFDDTAPAQIGVAGTPNVVAAPTRSLFQTDSMAIRMLMDMNWTMRRTGVITFISGVTW